MQKHLYSPRIAYGLSLQAFFFRSLLAVLLLLLLAMASQAQTLKGLITDAETGEPLVGACLIIKGTNQGNCTDLDGNFSIEAPPAPPFEIVATYIGYDSLTYEVNDLSETLKLALAQENVRLQTVEVKSKSSQLKRDVSLTIESIGLQEIQSTTESSFYDALASVRETDFLTVSFGVKVINSRGFNSSTPVRSLQLIDGVDNASPGLNYPLGNFLGLAELDVVGVDLVIGASSSYFGPGAFNGVVNMRTKNPFEHQGLEVNVKGGDRTFFETSMRYGKAFKNKKGVDKFAFKVNVAYNQIYDWEANDLSPSRSSLRDSIYEDNGGGFDAVNRYGDEVNSDFRSLFEQFRHPGLGKFFRTGYAEKDLVDYDSYNLKSGLALHYRPAPGWEVIGSSHFGLGRTVMQLDNRLNLDGVWAMQNKFEVRKQDKFFFRFYHTREDAGKTFDIVNTAYILQERWKSDGDWLNDYKNYWFRNINPKVKELPGFPSIGPPPDFFYDFDKANEVLSANADSIRAWHAQTRAVMDGAFLHPGTKDFNEVYQDIISTKVSEGGTRYVDKSSLYHAHTEYRFKPRFLDEVTVGGNFRLYTPYSEGTIFSDTAGTTIRTYEYGIYAGAEKWFANDRLKVNVALRFDKHENYGQLLSPSFSAIYSLSPGHSLRLSASSALRNPTLIEQYYYFRVGRAILLGNLYGYENLITLESFEEYLDNNLDQSYLEYFSSPAIKPEKVVASELAYSGLFFNNKVDLKATYYLNHYQDFIGFLIGLQVPFFQGFPGTPTIYRFPANARDVTLTTGFSTGLTYYMNQYFTLSANHSWNTIVQVTDDPLIPAYNTPKNKINLGINGRNLTLAGIPNIGFGASFRWVEGYTFESSPQFSGRIPAQIYLNAQISKSLPKINSTIKISGSNLLDRKQNGLYGGPDIGRFVFASWYYSIP